METDPVCHMPVEKRAAAVKVVYLGKTHYFCSPACHKAFTADPQRYVRNVTADTGGSAERRV